MLKFFQICSDEPLIYAAMEIEFSQDFAVSDEWDDIENWNNSNVIYRNRSFNAFASGLFESQTN